MKIIKTVYDEKCKFILEIIKNLPHKRIFTEFYNYDNKSERKIAQGILTRFGTKKLPLIVFEDENLIEYNAIWSERNPDWKEEINKILNNENS
jgi:hypothetical protein